MASTRVCRPSKRSSTLLANVVDTPDWSSPRTFTQKLPTSRIRIQESESWPGQNETRGGSSETLVNDPMVMPSGPPGQAAVTTVTPVG